MLKRKGKGKDRGIHFTGATAFFRSSAYFRAKGEGGKSSGKGFSRKENLKGRVGQVLECSIFNSRYGTTFKPVALSPVTPHRLLAPLHPAGFSHDDSPIALYRTLRSRTCPP